MNTRERLKGELEKLNTLPDIEELLKDYMDDETDEYANLFIQRAYQLGLETGLEAQEEYGNLQDLQA